MSAIDDARVHQEILTARFGGQDLPDVGGGDPARRLAVYREELARVRGEDRADRDAGTLGWDTLLHEELLEAITAVDDEHRYDELIDLIGAALCWADALRRR